MLPPGARSLEAGDSPGFSHPLSTGDSSPSSLPSCLPCRWADGAPAQAGAAVERGLRKSCLRAPRSRPGGLAPVSFPASCCTPP